MPFNITRWSHLVFSIRFEFIESKSHIAPKPTPRASKPIGSTDSATNRKSIGDEFTTSKDTDDEPHTTVDRSSGDFSETKKFWQSLESSHSVGSIDDPQMPPVPKPRSQSQAQVPTVQSVNDDFDSIERTSISLVEESISQVSSSLKISSEGQVERSESSSLKSKPEIIRDDEDSITDRLENESFPIDKHSDKIDSDPYESKLDSLEYDSTERSSSSIYKVKERENILDDVDDEDKTDHEDKGAAFYIGESSGNIITKTATEKRSEFAYDNEGYESKDSTKLEQQPIKIPDDISHGGKRDSQHEVRFNLQPEEIGVAAYGKDDDFATKLERIPTGMDKSLEEKCETELSEKIIHESPIPTDLKEDEYYGSEKSFGSEVSYESENVEESHVEIQELSSASESNVDANKFKQQEEPVICFPEENVIEEESRVRIEQLDSFDSAPPTEPQNAAVIHSPIEQRKLADEFEYAAPIDTNIYAQESGEYIEKETSVNYESPKVTETTLIQPISIYEDDDLITPKSAPVVHSPIETKDIKTSSADDEPLHTKSVAHSPLQISSFDLSDNQDALKEEAVEKKLIDDFSYGLDKPATAKVVHSPIDSSIKLEQQIKEEYSGKDDTQAEIIETHNQETGQIDPYSFDFGTPKAAPVVHSPIKPVGSWKQEPQFGHEKIDDITQKVEFEESKQPADIQTGLHDDLEEGLEAITTPIVHSFVENVANSSEECKEKIIGKIETVVEQATQKPASDEFKQLTGNKSELLDDYSFDFGKTKPAPVLHSPVESARHEFDEPKSIDSRTEELSQRQPIDETSVSIASKSEVIHRIGTSKVTPKTRWSTNDPDHSSPSSQSLENSRPCSSDVENLFVSYPNSSAEYQTALDASSLIPGSTEYHTAVSTFDHSGKTISSQESMKSLDSESSGNLGSVEVSEASETLVPSTAELDFDENEQRLSSLDTFGDNVLEENVLDFESDDISGPMKRSHEMIFSHDIGTVQSLESLNSVEKSELSERKASDEEFKAQSEVSSDETKFGTSVGSNLSMSFSTTSNADTIVENIQEDMASSYGAGSLVGSYDTKTILLDEGTSFDQKFPSEPVENLVMTTTTVTEDNVTSVNTQITTDVKEDEMTPRRGKGHKRNDSTSFLSGLDMAKLSQESTDSCPDNSSLDDEMIIHDVPDDERKESGSDSDYDRYETEYSRSFKKPGVQRKKKTMAPKSAQKPEPEQLERKKSIPSIETIVEVSEDVVETEKLRSRGASQNMQDYSQIPDITITDDPTKYVSDDEDFEEKQPEPEPEIVAVEDSKSEVAEKPEPIRQPKEPKISHEEYEKLIERQYKTQEDPYEPKADSPTSDSFELVEQPDISDEFVIIEEVAKEADELMTEGKSVSIQQTKYVKKHDDEVEKIVIKSAPAATNEGSTLLHGRHDLAFEFEESPSSGANTESSEEGAGMESSRKWIEMQLAEQAQNMRYPYDVDRGILEDIKEEDTDFEVGSSRISSFKDSYSSNDFEAAAARRYHSKDQDNVSVNSLQEFERLEQAISLENKRFHSSSNDSFSNGSFPKRGLRTAQADEISLCSLQDFEGLENACLEATLLELKAKEEHALLLSRSDESNKSGGQSDDGAAKITEKTTTIVTKAQPLKSSIDPFTGGFSTSQTTVTRVITEIKSKIEPDDDFSSSNIMEVSTDSLEAKQSKAALHSKNTSQHGSSDSLEINKSADIMTSSIDSIEISKDGATTKSSKSDGDSIEQIVRGDKRDSIDSIDAQYAAMTQSIHMQRDSFDANLLDLTSSGIMGGSYITDGKNVTTTSMASSSGYGGGISKDISSDSLNLNQEPELLITSTESLDHTSSTFATYQSQTDSQMTMSGSMTSCDSNTLVDTCDTTIHSDFYHSGAGNLLPDDKFGVRMTSTTVTTTSAYKTKSSSNDVDKS